MTTSETAPQLELVEALTAALRTNPQVRAAWLEGSLGRGADADRYSDIDLHVLVEPTAEAEFRAGLEDKLSAVRPLLFYRSLPYGSLMAMVMFDNFVQLEAWVHAGEQRSVTGGRATVLLERDNAVALETSKPADSEAVNRALEHRLEDFWFGVSHTAKVGRGELIAAVHGLSHQAEYLADVMMFGRGALRNVGMGRVNQYLEPAVQRELERVLALPEVSPVAVTRAYLALANLMRRVGREVAARRGVPYPAALEAAVLGHVRRELTRLDLAFDLEEVSP